MTLAGGWRLLRRHLGPHRRALWHMALWSAVEGVPVLGSGLIVARAIDHGFLAGAPYVGVGWLAVLALLWIAGAAGARQVYPWLADTVEPLRDALVTDVVTASLRRALRGEDTGGGETVSQTTQQVQAVRTLLSALLRNTRQLVSAGVAALVGLIALSPWLALAVVPCVAVALIVFVMVLRVMAVRYRAVILTGERVSAVATPVIEGVRDVAAHGAERRAAAAVGEVVEVQAEALRAFGRMRALRLPVLTLGVHVPLIALLGMSPWLVAHHGLTTGAIAGAVTYLFSGLRPAFQVLVDAGSTVLVSLGVILGRLAAVCDEGPVQGVGEGGARPSGYGLSADGLTFAYSQGAEPVVRDLSLDVSEGTHLAVVGPSGVGKSTLANLLAGLVPPRGGVVTFSGCSLDEVDEPYLRTRLALIPQEAYIFAGTVRDNLAYLRPDADEPAMREAVAAVGLGETVARLGGLDAEIPPGGGALSPGERQLVALARVFLSPADVVILDEATCHLDPPAEERAERAFARRHGALVVIAHRISSARRADRILVMDGTDAVEGTHDELLARSDLYADLVGHWTGVGGTSLRS